MIRHSPSFSLVDRSASVGEAAVAALPQALELVAPHRAQPGVIAFADQAQVLSPPGSGFTGELPAAAIPPWGTNLAAALELALALLPPGPGELLLLSDGRATAGDTLAALARARSRGVPVHVLPVGRSSLASGCPFRPASPGGRSPTARRGKGCIGTRYAWPGWRTRCRRTTSCTTRWW